MNIKILGAHNTESRHTRCTCLLLDEVLSLDAGGLTSSLAFPAQQKLAAVLLTHHHYDHIKDIPALAMNCYLRGTTLDIYGTETVLETTRRYLLDGALYPAFLNRPEAKPTLRFNTLNNGQPRQILEYYVLPVAMPHAVPASGFQVKDKAGRVMFYSGDTGPDLDKVWAQITPQLMFLEVTGANEEAPCLAASGHLAPRLLEDALKHFFAHHGYLPRIIAVHMNPAAEDVIRAELSTVAANLHVSIEIGREDQIITL